MTIYATMNPLGSTHPKDLRDNSQNLDYWSIGPLYSYPDRLGVNRLSRAGIEASFAAAQANKQAVFDASQAARAAEYSADKLTRDTVFAADQSNRENQFNAFMDASGFEPPVAYAAGITLTRTTQTVTYLGSEYRAKSAFIPLTTSNWAADQPKLKLIGDDSLRQDLSITVLSKRFVGTAGDDAGTPDAVFKADRTHNSNTSPHSFRDQTRYEPLGDTFTAACSFDAAMYSSGIKAIDHMIGFQSRLNHYSTGLLTTFYGSGSFNVAHEAITNAFSFYANDTLEKTATGQYGFYNKPIIKGSLSNAYGMVHNPGVFAPAVVNNSAGVQINTVTGDGTVNNEFGLLVNALTKGAVKWPVYVTAQTGTSFFGSPTRIENTLSVGGAVVQLSIGGLTSTDFPAITYNYDPRANTAIFASQVSGFQWSAAEFKFRYALAASPGATPSFSNLLTIRTAADSEFGAIAPGADNTQNLGRTAFRWKQIYAATTTISTSDAREKTEVRSLVDNELAAAKALAKEFGIYKWLASVNDKGDAARHHVGMTVQRAIEIMEEHGLEPMSYGFICYDQWDEQIIEHEALTEEHAAEVVEHDAVYEPVQAAGIYSEGRLGDRLISEAWTEVVSEAWTEVRREAWSEVIPAGDRYSFRFDGLLAFVAIGFEARLNAIESALDLS